MPRRALSLAVIVALAAPIAGCFEHLEPPKAEQAETDDTRTPSDR